MNIRNLMLFAVFLDSKEITDGMGATGCHYHSLGFTCHALKGHFAEFLYYDSCLFVDCILVIVMESLQRYRGRCFLIVGIILRLTCYFVWNLIRCIVLQHVFDKAFFNGLQHWVVVISLVLVLVWGLTFFSQDAESLERFGLRGSCECIERKIVVLSLT